MTSQMFELDTLLGMRLKRGRGPRKVVQVPLKRGTFLRPIDESSRGFQGLKKKVFVGPFPFLSHVQCFVLVYFSKRAFFSLELA